MNEYHGQKGSKGLVANWFEERAVAHIDTAETESQIQKYGHRGLLSVELGAKMEDVTTVRATYVQHQTPGVRHKGRRIEFLEKQLAQSTRQRIEQQMKPAPCVPEYRSVTVDSYSVPGFIPFRERLTPVHDYKSQSAISYWSENHQHIQGVSPVSSANTPFRKCSNFSRPISERLDEVDPPLKD